MKKKSFKVGDRVRVYAATVKSVLATKGVITQTEGDLLYVEFDERSSIGNYRTFAHPKQCRRLKPKKPVEKVGRRIHCIMEGKLVKRLAVFPEDDSVEFIELLPGACEVCGCHKLIK